MRSPRFLFGVFACSGRIVEAQYVLGGRAGTCLEVEGMWELRTMAIVAECSSCGKRFKADASKAGKRAKCSNCGAVFVIGGGGGSAGAAAGALTPTNQGREANVEEFSAEMAAAPSPATRVARPLPAESPAKLEIEAETIVQRDVHSPAPTMTTVAAPAALTVTAPSAKPDRSERRGPGKALLAIAALVLAGGVAAAVVGPRLLGKGGGSTSGERKQGNWVTPSELPKIGPAWSAQPDGRAAAVKLPDDFRMAIPAQAPLRHDPASLVVAAPPGPLVAVTLLPDAVSTLVPTIEVWHLETRRRVAQFRLNQSLSSPVLSADGAYYAGHVYDPATRGMRAEIWSTASGVVAYQLDIPSGAEAIAGEVVLGFPVEDQVAIYGERLAVWDLTSKRAVREVGLPPRSPDTHAAASARVKLVAVADSRTVTMVDMERAKVLGSAAIPEAARSHPRQALTLRAMGFSPDGTELALVLDNRQSARRIVMYDVASGALKSLQAPTAVVQNGGPIFQWMPDSQGFLVSSGVLLDRPAGRQVGQIYTDLPDEGLGGVLVGLLDGERALAAWDKFPKSLALRSISARRERAEWLRVQIAAATAARYATLQCVGREFGNASATQALLQNGRLTDGSQFLVVTADFTAAVAADAPTTTVPLRADQFVLLADDQPRLPIGSLTREGNFSLERPGYDVRKALAVPRKRSLVFAVSGTERTLALQIGSARVALTAPDAVAGPAVPALEKPVVERLPTQLFGAADDVLAAGVRVTSARAQAYELSPEAADSVPLHVTYAAPPKQTVVSVTFELTATTARAVSRGGSLAPPRMGLMLSGGEHLRPVVELPGPLPVTLAAGERRTQTCLFVVPAPAAPRMRLTYEDVPVAVVEVGGG